MIEKKQQKKDLIVVTGLGRVWRVSTGEAKTGLFMLSGDEKAFKMGVNAVY